MVRPEPSGTHVAWVEAMTEHVVIIGGGLAGLSAGCYARASGFKTTIVEHNLALGGVCTAWNRGSYVIDGCIQWLTGGPFAKLYAELGILPKVGLHTIDEFFRYRDVKTGVEISLGRDLDRLAHELIAISLADADEIRRLMAAARELSTMDPGLADAPELAGVTEALSRVWDSRHAIGALIHYRSPIEDWLYVNIANESLRRFFRTLVPPGAPALVMVFVLGYLGRGWLSRPNGGSGKFRDALVATYERLGGESMIHTTVDEILVEHGFARGVRLADGRMVMADAVVSTSSTPETVLRLLGGRYGADDLRRRMAEWKLFDPIALVSYGIASPLEGIPSTLVIDGIAPFEVGGRLNERLHVRIFNDDPLIAPAGHTVVQALLTTDYDWWATRGSGYLAAKEDLADRTLARLEEFLPRLGRSMEVADVATPLTFWSNARSWRGAYEGFLPRTDSFFGHVPKHVPDVQKLYLAGQWVEPGGGVPTAIASGRQVVQLICNDHERTFAVPS